MAVYRELSKYGDTLATEGFTPVSMLNGGFFLPLPVSKLRDFSGIINTGCYKVTSVGGIAQLEITAGDCFLAGSLLFSHGFVEPAVTTDSGDFFLASWKAEFPCGRFVKRSVTLADMALVCRVGLVLLWDHNCIVLH